MRSAPTYLTRDLGIAALSVAVAVLIVQTGILGRLLAAASSSWLAASFLAGAFFVSVFTVAPAAAVLVELFRIHSLLGVAILGGLGALAGDWVMFRFFRDRITGDVEAFLRRAGSGRALAILRLRYFRWLTPLLGAIVVASPLPDELGLALLGLSRLRTVFFLPLSFALNFLGILAVGLAVRLIG